MSQRLPAVERYEKRGALFWFNFRTERLLILGPTAMTVYFRVLQCKMHMYKLAYIRIHFQLMLALCISALRFNMHE